MNTKTNPVTKLKSRVGLTIDLACKHKPRDTTPKHRRSYTSPIETAGTRDEGALIGDEGALIGDEGALIGDEVALIGDERRKDVRAPS